MTIRKLKEIIKDLPDDMRIYRDYTGLSVCDDDEFISLVTYKNNNDVCILQTRDDIDVNSELEARCDRAVEEFESDLDFWMDVVDIGFKPSDFEDSEHAEENMKNYGLI